MIFLISVTVPCSPLFLSHLWKGERGNATVFSDLFWVGEQDGRLPPAGVTTVYVGNNEVARATFGKDDVGGKTYNGWFQGALDGQKLLRHGGYQVLALLTRYPIKSTVGGWLFSNMASDSKAKLLVAKHD